MKRILLLIFNNKNNLYLLLVPRAALHYASKEKCTEERQVDQVNSELTWKIISLQLYKNIRKYAECLQNSSYFYRCKQRFLQAVY